MEVSLIHNVIFYLFATTAVVSAFFVITRRNPVISVLWLVVTIFSLAGTYVLLDADLLATLQVLVYAGAIMVLFLFVIMLLNLGEHDYVETPLSLKVKGGLLTLLFLIGVLLVVTVRLPHLETALSPESAAAMAGVSNTKAVGTLLYTKYLYPFEIVSILLLAAIVGAVVLARKWKKPPQEAVPSS